MVSLDPTCSMVVTGGQDDRGFVWKMEDMSLLFECGGDISKNTGDYYFI